MSGLTPNQLGEVVSRVARQLEDAGQPWDKIAGRPRELTLRDAVIVTCAYLRQNIIEEVLAEIFDVSQATISRAICDLTPIISAVTDSSDPRPSKQPPPSASREPSWSTGSSPRAGPGT